MPVNVVVVVLVIALAGCGRIGFTGSTGGPDADAAADAPDAPIDVLEGHDEDGDGVPDAIDKCPHVPDDQTDADGDGVGAACDPDDARPGDTIALFDPMLALDPAISFVAGTWIPGDDTLDLESTVFAELIRDFAIADADVWIGLDVVEVTGTRQQLIIHPSVNTQPLPRYYGQLFREDGVANNVSVVAYDGSFDTLHAAQLPPAGVPIAPLELRLSARTSPPSLVMQVAWPGETFVAQADTPAYAGSPAFRFAADGLRLRVRYHCVIALP